MTRSAVGAHCERTLHLHSTLVVSTEGLPLGVLGAQCSAPTPKAKDDRRAATAIPIDEKKTFAWIKGLRECIEVADELPDTRQVCVMDREADFFELFDEQRQSCGVDLLVRAKHDRATNDELNLFESVRQSPVQSQLRINVPRQSSRPKKSKHKARAGHEQRMAQVDLRYRRIEFRPPSHHQEKEPITVWVVHVLETSSPADARPVEWFLLTTREIPEVEQAQECLRWYCLRWRIEDWHRVLKSGCRIEALQHKTAERHAHDPPGQRMPGAPRRGTVLRLGDRGAGGLREKKRIAHPTRLGDAVRLVARLGGYLGRANDPPPGHQLMWQGYSQLQAMCEGYSLRDSLRDVSGLELNSEVEPRRLAVDDRIYVHSIRIALTDLQAQAMLAAARAIDAGDYDSVNLILRRLAANEEDFAKYQRLMIDDRNVAWLPS